MPVSKVPDGKGGPRNDHWVHWSWDSWALAHSTATSSVRTGGEKWFITADYAFGHAAEQDATTFIEAAGGQVLGAVR